MKITSALFVLLLFSAMPHRLSAQAPSGEFANTKHIEVTGSAEMEVVPDEVYVNFNLQEFLNKSKVKISIETIKKEFLDSCHVAGIAKENIEVGSFGGIDLNYWRRKKNPDFRASMQIVIKFSKPEEVQSIMSRLNEDAVTSVKFSKIDHSKMEEFRRQLKIEALQNSKQKASYLCESIGEKMGEALVIEEIETPVSYSYNREYSSSNSSRLYQSSNFVGIAGGNDEQYLLDFRKLKLRFEVRAVFALH